MHNKYTQSKRERLTQKDIDYLKYRPEYGFYPKIMTTMSPEDVAKISPMVDRATEILPSSIMGAVNDLLENIDILQKRMKNCLKDVKGNGVSFKEYDKEKRSDKPDYSKITAYESFHSDSVNGSVQAEVYPILLEMELEFKEYRDELNKEFFNKQANYENLKKTREKEEREIEDIVAKDLAGNTSGVELRKLNVKSQLSRIAMDRVKNSSDFIKDTNKVLCSTINEYYNDDIRGVVSTLAEAPLEVLDNLLEVNKSKFRNTVHLYKSDKRRGDRLNNKEIRKGISQMVFKAGKMKSETSESILEWVKSVDTDEDQNNLTQLVVDTIERLEFINDESDSVMLEGFKHNTLDEMQKQDSLDTLQEKKNARQMCNLISDIISEKKNNTFEIDKFLLDRKLEHPGTLCTP